MEPLKDAKQFLSITHVKARSVIAHEIDFLALIMTRANLDLRPVFHASEFDRVGQQIDKHLPE
jgi:hypothetical protein